MVLILLYSLWMAFGSWLSVIDFVCSVRVWYMIMIIREKLPRTCWCGIGRLAMHTTALLYPPPN